MKILMMGTGGVGGYYGARLAEAGHDVTFVARGKHAEAMRRDGLHIESERGALHLAAPQVVRDPAAAGTVDLVVIAVKLWDTGEAARAVLPAVGDGTTVVSLQNGVDKDDVIGGLVGKRHLVGGLTYINVVISAPGVITHTGKVQRVIVAELDGQRSARTEAIAAALGSGGIDAEVTTDIRRATWEKFIFLCAHSGSTAATRQPIGAVRALPATRRLLEDAMGEGVALAAAEGVRLADDFVAGRMAFIDSMPADARASMAQDLARGNRLELDWLSGTIVRLAERHGLDVPVHRTLYAVLAPYASGAAGSGG